LPGGGVDAAPLAAAFRAAWRRHRLDVLAALALFAGASLAAARVWRFPIDDEVFTLVPLVPAEFQGSLWALARFYLAGGDFHPPLTFLFFASLYRLGAGEAALHLCSLTMTAAALALWQLLVLAMIGMRGHAPVGSIKRAAIVLLFGLTPLAIGQGDAIRWYPQFAFCVALFATLYLAANRPAARVGAAVPLGLAASINLIAPLAILPFAAYRYLFERKWRRSFDIAFWAVVVLFAVPGLWTAVSLIRHGLPAVYRQVFGGGPLFAVAVDGLGVFGGNAVAVGHPWAVAPAIAVCAIAIVTQFDRRNLADPAHLPILLLATAAAAALAGFSEPRSFLYLAPVIAALLALYVDSRTAALSASLVVFCAVLPALVAIGDLRAGTRPFKRNAATPVAEALDFIAANRSGDTLVIAADPVITWELAKEPAPDLCNSYFFSQPCAAEAGRYQSVFVVNGHTRDAADDAAARHFAETIAKIGSTRSLVATRHLGEDRDAALKTRLTGVPLDEFILTVELYR
jgi:hypothetical protein